MRSRDYGSGKRNLLYFRKFRFGVRRIECGLRKWEEKLIERMKESFGQKKEDTLQPKSGKCPPKHLTLF